MKKAYFFAPARREVYVALSWEDCNPGEEDMCGLLLKSLYGTRDAAANWAEAYTRVLTEELGFAKGESSPCSFHHADRDIKVVVHGDDFVSEGPKANLLWMDKAMRKHFELKTEILGPDVREVKEVRILNRVLRWEEHGISWEADQRHAELVVEQLGLGEARPVTSPGSKDEERRETVSEAKRARMLDMDVVHELIDEKWERRRASQDDIRIHDGSRRLDPHRGPRQLVAQVCAERAVHGGASSWSHEAANHQESRRQLARGPASERQDLGATIGPATSAA